MTPQVVLLRGTAANPWELHPWVQLHEDGVAQVRLVVPPDNLYQTSSIRLPTTRVRTVGALAPPGPAGRFLVKAVGQRHLRLEPALRDADIVHAAELGYWFSWQAARLKRRLGYRLALTVWETLPFVDAYRNVRTRRYRRDVLENTDLFLAATERARDALALEGVQEHRIRLSPPGIDVTRFAAGPSSADPPASTVLLSIGRLVWEKGHQDLLRALALVRRRVQQDVRALIVGVGPEERRLRAVARDLGVADAVEFRGFVPHDELPAVFAERFVFGPGESADFVLGRAVRHGARGGDGGAPPRDRVREWGNSRGPCRLRNAVCPGRLARAGSRTCRRPARQSSERTALSATRTTRALHRRRRGGSTEECVCRPSRGMTADVVVVTWHSGERVLACLDRLEAQEPPHQTWVIDNASGDGTVELVRTRHPEVKVLELERNVGFGAAVNAGAARGSGEAIVLVNDDVELEPGALAALLARLADPEVGMVAGLTTFPGSGLVDGFGIEADVTLAAYNRLRKRLPSQPSGVLLGPSGGLAAYRRSAFEQAGGFDERLFAYGEDVDLALRLRALGWRAAEAPGARGVHLGGASVGRDSPRQRWLAGFARAFLMRRYGVLGPVMRLEH